MLLAQILKLENSTARKGHSRWTYSFLDLTPMPYMEGAYVLSRREESVMPTGQLCGGCLQLTSYK